MVTVLCVCYLMADGVVGEPVHGKRKHMAEAGSQIMRKVSVMFYNNPL